MPVGLPGLAAACFILGVLLYSTVVRAEYPDIGSNFLPAVLSVALVFWIGSRMRSRKSQLPEELIICRAGKRSAICQKMPDGATLIRPTDHRAVSKTPHSIWCVYGN